MLMGAGVVMFMGVGYEGMRGWTDGHGSEEAKIAGGYDRGLVEKVVWKLVEEGGGGRQGVRWHCCQSGKGWRWMVREGESIGGECECG
jgi:hypothetical protein